MSYKMLTERNKIEFSQMHCLFYDTIQLPVEFQNYTEPPPVGLESSQ